MLTGSALPARAAIVDWASFTSANSTSVTGTIAIQGSGSIGVTYTGDYAFAQLNNSGAYYWSPAATFTGSTVSNTPGVTDFVALSGGTTNLETLTFSSPVVNPVLNILTLGEKGSPATFNFSAPFTILSQGPSSAYGGGAGNLTQPSPNILSGTEGDGTIMFTGTFTSLSWTNPQFEYFYGFTVGVFGAATVPEPSSLALCGVAGVVGLGLSRLRPRNSR